MKKFLVLFVLVAFLYPIQVFGHSGGTDKWGCHHDRKNGGYHCHNRPEKPTPKEAKKIKQEKVKKKTKIKKINFK